MNDPPKLTVWFPADRGREHQIEPIGDCQTRGAGRGIEPESRDDIVFRQRPVDDSGDCARYASMLFGAHRVDTAGSLRINSSTGPVRTCWS
jgi:hypothetical protein